MYDIEKKDFGFKLTFGDFIKNDEMENWLLDSEKVLNGKSGSFGVFVDMRRLQPLPQDSQETMVMGQQVYRQAGMQRSVVILDGPIITMQFKRLAKASGIYDWERYIDASATPDWEQTGVKWLVDGVDPDR
jgi:hypothetical protein